jgi:hypothetical protein
VPRFQTLMVSQQRSKIRVPIPKNGCVKYTTVQDIPEGVLAGTFVFFGHPVITLFDSGASHDFMSSTCAKREKLALIVTKPSYLISTPGRQVVAKQIATGVPLELAGQVFPTHLIVLDGHGITVILGMSWMKLHKAILDIAR